MWRSIWDPARYGKRTWGIWSKYEEVGRTTQEHKQKVSRTPEKVRYSNNLHRYASIERERKDMINKMNKLEQEKWKLSEKWIKLSAKNKNDDKVRNRLKELEDHNEKLRKELFSLTEKLNKNERENTMLRKANDSLQNTVNQQVKKSKV